MNAQTGEGKITLLFLLPRRWGLVVNATPGCFDTGKESRYPLYEVGWATGPV